MLAYEFIVRVPEALRQEYCQVSARPGCCDVEGEVRFWEVEIMDVDKLLNFFLVRIVNFFIILVII